MCCTASDRQQSSRRRASRCAMNPPRDGKVRAESSARHAPCEAARASGDPAGVGLTRGVGRVREPITVHVADTHEEHSGGGRKRERGALPLRIVPTFALVRRNEEAAVGSPTAAIFVSVIRLTSGSHRSPAATASPPPCPARTRHAHASQTRARLASRQGGACRAGRPRPPNHRRAC